MLGEAAPTHARLQAAGVLYEVVLEAGREIERRYRLNWWDSLVVAAAQAQGCVVLLSEDFQDGMAFGSVTVRSPFTLQAEAMAETYALAPARSRHPPRGRPKGRSAG